MCGVAFRHVMVSFAQDPARTKRRCFAIGAYEPRRERRLVGRQSEKCGEREERGVHGIVDGSAMREELGRPTEHACLVCNVEADAMGGMTCAPPLAMNMIRPLFIISTLAAATACASSGSPLKPTRDARISSIAKAACARYGDTAGGCPGYGTGSTQKYQTKDDCERDFANTASNMWPADKCSGGRINSDRYASCENDVKVYACSTGGSAFFSGITALDSCQSGKVCIDPP